ncbi:MAG: ABC transporter ATP-binding protein [Thaumarchaeota archaeon]|nr:ABC transporter ATP-binding protein [Nitrososphaerota archaeon]
MTSAIAVDSLSKSYGNLHAVDGISFNVEQGEVFSMLGPNGAGKTTTIEILEGLRQRDAGQVSVLGLDPWAKGYDLHKKIGVIPQGFKFFDYPTPREAIRYYAALFGVKVDADEILKQVILEDAGNVYFMHLSGGQKQKMGMALSLVNDPELVFLDEPTTGLDPAARRAVWEVIRNLRKEGRGVLLTTHYLEEAEELADRVAIMDHGKIITHGTVDEIISKHGSGERLTVRAGKEMADYLRQNTKLNVEYTSGKVSVKLGQKNDALLALGSMSESGIPYSEMTTKRDSLEDIFLRMVGEPMGDKANDAVEARING